jgi:hypothetical protein
LYKGNDLEMTTSLKPESSNLVVTSIHFLEAPQWWGIFYETIRRCKRGRNFLNLEIENVKLCIDCTNEKLTDFDVLRFEIDTYRPHRYCYDIKNNKTECKSCIDKLNTGVFFHRSCHVCKGRYYCDDCLQNVKLCEASKYHDDNHVKSICSGCIKEHYMTKKGFDDGYKTCNECRFCHVKDCINTSCSGRCVQCYTDACSLCLIEYDCYCKNKVLNRTPVKYCKSCYININHTLDCFKLNPTYPRLL